MTVTRIQGTMTKKVVARLLSKQKIDTAKEYRISSKVFNDILQILDELDETPPLLVEVCAPELAPILCKPFSLSFTTGIFSRIRKYV